VEDANDEDLWPKAEATKKKLKREFHALILILEDFDFEVPVLYKYKGVYNKTQLIKIIEEPGA
jgi:hypothetical protein